MEFIFQNHRLSSSETHFLDEAYAIISQTREEWENEQDVRTKRNVGVGIYNLGRHTTTYQTENYYAITTCKP